VLCGDRVGMVVKYMVMVGDGKKFSWGWAGMGLIFTTVSLFNRDDSTINTVMSVTSIITVWTDWFFACDSICCKRAYAIAIPSVCLSVRHTGDSCKNG